MRYHSLRRYLLFIMLMLFTALSLNALSLNAQASDQAKVRLLVEEYPPYLYVTDGKIEGSLYPAIERFFEDADVSFSTEVYPWSRAHKLVMETPNVAIAPIVRVGNREEKLKWLKKLTTIKAYVYKLKSRDDIPQAQSIDELFDCTFGAYSNGADYLYLKEKGAPNIDVLHNYDLNIRKLMRGRVDLMLTSPEVLAYYAKDMGIDIQLFEPVMEIKDVQVNLFVAINKDSDTQIVDELEAIK